MSETDLPIDSKCLEVLDAALRRSTQLSQILPDKERESTMRSGQSELQRLAESLRNPPPATMWLKDPVLAKYLPIVLRLQDTSIDDPGRSGSMQRLLMGDAGDRPWRWTPWIYPAAVFISALLVAILLGTTIVPTFKQMFLEFDLMLPAATKWLIWGSDSITQHPIESMVSVIVLLTLLGLGVISAGWIADRLPSGSILARLLSGSRSQVMGMARWTGSLAEMLHLGMPMSQAVVLAGMLSGKSSLELQSIRLAQGESNRAYGLSPVALAALNCDDSQKRVALLRSLSDLYWNRITRRTRASAGWIAPIAVVIVGAFVAFVVIALFMPLVSLITSLSS
ncbi:MAG: hypothetical protein MUF23_13815 [Pirellula sp.]|nr:hypothetical protein [Pirellula sp.]